MGSRARGLPRCRDQGPVFGRVAPEIIEDTLISLAKENEQYLSNLSDRAGLFKDPQTVGEGLLRAAATA